MSIRLDQVDLVCRSLPHSRVQSELARGVTNVSLLPKRDEVPTKFRDKQKFYAIKKQTDTKAGITRWEPQSGTLRDLQYSAALSGLPMSLIHVTPTRAEPYEIVFFDKYKTMDDSISSTGTNVPLGTFSLASPAERLKHYIRTKLTEGHLIILQIHTGPQQYHFATVTKLRTPLNEGFHDHYTPMTNIGSTSTTSEVAKGILSAKGISLERAQPALPAVPAPQNPAPAAAGPSSEQLSDPLAAEATGVEAVAADADASSTSTPPLLDGGAGAPDDEAPRLWDPLLAEGEQHNGGSTTAPSHTSHTSSH